MILALSIVVSVAVLLQDMLLPLGVAGGVPYVALVLIASRSPRQQTTLLAALAGGVLTIVGFFLSPSGGTEWVVFVNRFYALLAIALTALFSLWHKRQIAEREEAEGQLHDRESRLQSVLDNIADGIITINELSEVESFNTAAEQIYGYSRDEVVGENVRVLMPKAYHSESETYLGIDRTHGGTKLLGSEREVSGRRKDGTVFPVDLIVTEFSMRRQRLFIAIVRDITRRKEIEQALAQNIADLARSNSELEQFAYVASHDLKAPLRGIANLAAWIQEDAGEVLPPESQEHLQQLHRRVERMDRLLLDLLQYSRAGLTQEGQTEISTRDMIEEIIELLDPPAEFAIEVAEDMPVIKTFEAPLKQVFMNLIGNSIKHCDHPDGKVEISARETGSSIEFAVADDGPGVPEEYRQRIFKIFQTLRPRDEVEGSGMGLAIVEKIVNARGGTIDLESAEGRGSIFRFTWPE